MPKNNITILGAGLVGSLLSILLIKKGFQVTVYEKRNDLRVTDEEEGRSINLALSHRGIMALKKAEVYDQIKDHLIPMNGRLMHDLDGSHAFQPYGQEGQHINSVSRRGLNKRLITIAEKAGVTFCFNHKCISVDLETTSFEFEVGNTILKKNADLLIGADGAFSILRRTMQHLPDFEFEEHFIEHGYKELTIPALNGDFAMKPNYLHIWPRGNFMLIALPNPDKSFTCTLFFPLKGSLSFDSIKTPDQVQNLFEKYFPDVVSIMPRYKDQFFKNPTSNLGTIKTFPWHTENTLLIGDASHAIVPFYGQGMNAGFEDCRLLLEWGEEMDFDWDNLLPCFSKKRKKEADAIAELSLRNFIEMRDKVGDEEFLNAKKVERRLQEAYPNEWIPLYSMVTFSDIPYSKAFEIGVIQKRVMNTLPDTYDPEKIDLEPIIERFHEEMHLIK